MRGLGLLVGMLITFNVVFSAFADNCGVVQSCAKTSIACHTDGVPQSSSNDGDGGQHCLIHCTHHANFILPSLNISIQLPEQEQSSSYVYLQSSVYLSSPFRPPII